VKEIVPLITAWYEENRKPLPWRQDPTPYHVWISEIMLQQTRIEAVIPYYRRFLAAFPTVKDLAEADDDRLMKLWEGLGYYSRARNLKKAAAVILSDYGGELPQTAEELRKLPGIGDYTAGAVASIACGEPEPAVDGNVLRVFSRITASEADIALAKTKRDTAELLRGIYPRGREAGLFTEGLMELGEAVCIPNGKPRCEICPVREHCQAYFTGTTDCYPVKSEKKPRRKEELTVLLLRDEAGRYAVRKRGRAGLLAGLWEFPNLPGTIPEKELAEAVGELGFRMTEIRPLGTARHIFTHVEWHMTGWEIRCRGENTAFTFAHGSEIRADYAVPAAFRHYTDQMTD